MNQDKIIIEEYDLLVRIFISEKEKIKGQLLYEYVVEKCKELGIAGATVIKGIMGYGADKRVHAAKFVDIMDDMPVIVEIIDTEDKISKLKPHLDEVLNKGFITIEKVHVVRYRKV